MAQFEDTKAITGAMVTLFANGYPCGVVTNVEVQIRRDVQPLHVMFGTPNPAAWGYGIRRVSGRMDFASLNGEGAMGIIPTNYTYYMSMTESLEILDIDGNVTISDDAIDDSTGLLSSGYSSTLSGGEDYSSALASLQLKEAALASIVANGDSGTAGIATWTKQTPRYLDQVTSVNLTFIAFLEGQVAKMYSRTLYQLAFHTHNIQVGMTVGDRNM